MATLTNPTGRKTEARIATIRGDDYFFSYSTCIAFRGIDHRDGEYIRVRVRNQWGPTTGKHFRELGCADFPECSPAELTEIVRGPTK